MEDLDYFKSHIMLRVDQMQQEIESFRSMNYEEIQNLRKENQAFSREIDRYDTLYRKMLGDYMTALEENKKLILKQSQLESQVNQYSINSATI